MSLINIALIILSIGIITTLSFKFFWFFSVIFLYRFVSYFITFDWVSNTLGIDKHYIYFLFILSVSFGIHYLIIRMTYDLLWVKYVFFILIVIWVFRSYDFNEIFLLKDWLEYNGLWGWENIKEQLIELFTTTPKEFEGYFTNAFKNVGELLGKVFKIDKG